MNPNFSSVSNLFPNPNLQALVRHRKQTGGRPRTFTKNIKISARLKDRENSAPVRASGFTNVEDGDESVAVTAQKSSDIERTTGPNGVLVLRLCHFGNKISKESSDKPPLVYVGASSSISRVA